MGLDYGFKKEDSLGFDIDSLVNYQKEFVCEEIEVCSNSSVKSYMSYKSITSRSSKQYKYIQEFMDVDSKTGLLINSDNFIGVALGSYFGDIGSRYYFTLDSGIVLPIIKIEEKADEHVYNGCSHRSDSSVIEFVIDTGIARQFFGEAKNGYILQGNFNNYSLFKGDIVKIEKVKEEVNPDYIEHYSKTSMDDINYNPYQYASGY